ncbi:MAG TPA: recombination mediator RecR [bacterium]|nr:recombination mediator RecR [bacterium]HPN67750.1 recombination mediator RecR [bacterium]
MQNIPRPIENLINHFSKLPGIGPKTASRLTYHLLKKPKNDVYDFGQALTNLQKDLIYCSKCHNYTQIDPCLICQNPKKNPSTLCVVEQPLDVIAIEKTSFNGIYHVLHGALAPIEGIGPEHLTLEHLLRRIKQEQVTELIIATNPNLAGEATAVYIQNMLKNIPDIHISRLAFGLPMGSDIEYVDEITLSKAFEGRK